MHSDEDDKRASETLPDGTFRACGREPLTERDRIDTCELAFKARLLGSTFAETARLFCWVKGATALADLTTDTIDEFCGTLRQIGKRFPTSAQHYETSAEAAINLTHAHGLASRDPSTIARHRNRLMKLLLEKVTPFEDRIRKQWFSPKPDEVFAIEGWMDHCCFLVVERYGRIVYGAGLATFDRMKASPKPRTMVADFLDEAERLVDGVEEQGRAFVATRHGGDLLLLAGFWNAPGARASPRKPSTPGSGL